MNGRAVRISSGMEFDNTIVMNRGRFSIDSGGTASHTTVYASGSMNIFRGVADDTTLSGGTMYIQEGAVSGVTVHSGATVRILRAQVVGVVENGGYVSCLDPSSVTFVPNTFSGLALYQQYSATVHSGTTANSTVVRNYAVMDVYAGGIVSDTMIKSQGTLRIFSGGTASDTNVFDSGVMMVSSGQVTGRTSVYSGGTLQVDGGTVTGIAAGRGGQLHFLLGSDTLIAGASDGSSFEIRDGLVSGYQVGGGGLSVGSGCLAADVTVRHGGTLEVSSGGTATGVVWTPCEGNVFVMEGATVSFASGYSGAYYGSGGQLVSNAAVLQSMSLDANETLHVLSGGTANEVFVRSSAEMHVSSGGTATNTGVEPFGLFVISSGGSAENTALDGCGEMVVRAGGRATGASVLNDACITVSSGGTATDITVLTDGHIIVSSGGTAGHVSLAEEGSLYVYEGGTAGEIELNAGSFVFESGATVSGITVNAGATFHVTSGMKLTEIVENGGYIVVDDGAEVTFRANVISAVGLDESSATVHSGTTIQGTTVGFGGLLAVFSGGSATDIMENGGYVAVEDGAKVSFRSNLISVLELFDSSSATLHSGTTAGSALIYEEGQLHVSGGTAIDAMVGDGGRLAVFSGGVANAATVSAYGSLEIFSGGTATDIDWMPCEGKVVVHEGGSATFVSAYSGVYWGEEGMMTGQNSEVEAVSLWDSGCNMYVFTGGVAWSTEAYGGGSIDVWSGGSAENTFIGEEGLMVVSSGGFAEGTYVDSWGHLHVSTGGVADNTEVAYSGTIHVSRGGVANDVTLNDSAAIIVEGGTAAGIMAEEDAQLFFTVTKDAWIEGASAGSSFLIRDGIVSDYGVHNGALTIGSGAVASNVAASDGELHVISGGTATDVEVCSWGGIHVSSGGTVDGATVDVNGYLYVSSGGTAKNACVSSSGQILVYSGGSAVGATVEAGGYLNFSRGALLSDSLAGSDGRILVFGGTAKATSVGAEGYFAVYTGGTADDTMVLSGGSFLVADRGSAGNTVVSSGGTMSVSDVATAAGITAYEGAYLDFSISSDTDVAWTYAGSSFRIEDGVLSGHVCDNGRLFFRFGGTVTDITVRDGGTVGVGSGGAANGVTVLAGGSAVIEDGCTTAGMVVGSGGTLSVGADAVITGVTASEGAYLDVTLAANTHVSGTSAGAAFEISGATLSGYAIGCGAVTVGNGCAASDVGVGAEGVLRVTFGGRVDGITVSGGGMDVASNGVAESAVVKSGSVRVYSGGTATATTLNTGSLDVRFGGLAVGTTVGDGFATVGSGGTLERSTVDGKGGIKVFSGGGIRGTVVSGGDVVVSAGGVADDTLVSGGRFSLFDGAANGITAHAGAMVRVYGGTATGIVENGGYVHVESGATAVFLANAISGSMTLADTGATIHSGTTANTVSVDVGGCLEVFSGGSVTTIVENGGYVQVEDGAVVEFQENAISGLAIGEEDSATVHSATTLNGVSVASDGTLEVFAGGTLTGRMTFASGAVVSAYAGSVLVFDLTSAAPGANVLVDGLSAIQGTPEYTLAISDATVGGKYLLASDAQTFDGTITVRDATGETLSDLAVGEWFTLDTTVYLLAVEDVSDVGNGVLTLTVAADARPVVSDVRLSTADPTNRDVVVTADFSGVLEIASELYRIGDGQTWLDYSDGVTVTDNTVVYFKAVDVVGNESEVVGCTVSNIDRIAPANPTASAVVTAFTNGDVLVSAVFSDDSAVREFSLDGSEWSAYESSVGFSSNGVVFFRGTDAAGNVSDVTGFTVANIDRTAPGAPSGLKAVVSDRTVALVWDPAADDLSGVGEYVVKYSLEGQEFTAATSGTGYVLTDAACGTWEWSVQAVDAAGNESADAAGASFTVSESVPPAPGPEPEPGIESLAKNDINGNGISDVTFHWTGGDHQIGFWLDGTSQWQSQAQSRSAAWNILGTYDVNADGNADLLMAGETTLVDMPGTYIGYYDGSIDTTENWRTIGFLINTTTWDNAVGNLTGAVGLNSIVWYAPELYSLGIWKDGREDWVALSDTFGGADWTLVGCGDFDGDGRDSVVMSGLGGAFLYTADIDGTVASMGAANWAGWEVRAIGDFLADGRDDLVLFHQETGSMVMLADGSVDDFASIGQLDAKDWFVVGAGDYNGDGNDDLLVRQYSTGMLGYYTNGDTAQWNILGYGVDMNWTVIA